MKYIYNIKWIKKFLNPAAQNPKPVLFPGYQNNTCIKWLETIKTNPYIFSKEKLSDYKHI